jgi:hypothetical protein
MRSKEMHSKVGSLISFDAKCVPMLIVLLSTLLSHVLSPNRTSGRFAL